MGLKVKMQKGQSVKVGEITITTLSPYCVIEIGGDPNLKIERHFSYESKNENRGQELSPEEQIARAAMKYQEKRR